MSAPSRPFDRRVMLAVVVLSGLIGALTGGTATWLVYRNYGPANHVVNQPVIAGGNATAVADIAQQHAVSLVSISTQPLPTGQSITETNFSNGFVYSADGLVVTSAHAIEGASQIHVATSDGHVYAGVVAASDSLHGVALLRLAGAANLTPLTLAGSGSRPGDLAVLLARGPGGATEVGAGTIRRIGAVASDGATPIVGALLADVTAGVGDDGAPLLDGNGAVIGVVTTNIAAGGGSVLAAPVDVVRAVAGSNGANAEQSAGVLTLTIDPGAAALLGTAPGALVLSVDQGGPAARAGIEVGQVITSMAGTAIDATHPFDTEIRQLGPGSSVSLGINRGGGGTYSATLTIAAR